MRFRSSSKCKVGVLYQHVVLLVLVSLTSDHQLAPCVTSLWHLTSFCGIGARVYTRLGNNELAEETARGGLAEAKKATTRIECHRVLGNVALRRGDAVGAASAFVAGLEEARATGMHLLELLCARDLLQHVPGREAEASTMMAEACARMGKPVSDFDELLAKRREW